MPAKSSESFAARTGGESIIAIPNRRAAGWKLSRLGPVDSSQHLRRLPTGRQNADAARRACLFEQFHCMERRLEIGVAAQNFAKPDIADRANSGGQPASS